jgi:hypothetical protein
VQQALAMINRHSNATVGKTRSPKGQRKKHLPSYRILKYEAFCEPLQGDIEGDYVDLDLQIMREEDNVALRRSFESDFKSVTSSLEEEYSILNKLRVGCC